MIYITLLPTHHFLLTQQTLPLHTSLCLWFIFSDQKWILTGQGDEERKINKKCNNHDHNHQPITDIPHGPPLNLGRKTPPEVELETIIPYDYRYKKSFKVLDSAQFSHSVDPMDCSMPGFPVHYQLPELAQTHVHQVGDVIQPSHPLSPFSSCLQSFLASGSFPVSQPFISGSQSIGTSASTLVLPMNIQDWFPLGLTSLISLLSKGLSRDFSNTTIQKHQFFGA